MVYLFTICVSNCVDSKDSSLAIIQKLVSKVERNLWLDIPSYIIQCQCVVVGYSHQGWNSNLLVGLTTINITMLTHEGLNGIRNKIEIPPTFASNRWMSSLNMPTCGFRIDTYHTIPINNAHEYVCWKWNLWKLLNCLKESYKKKFDRNIEIMWHIKRYRKNLRMVWRVLSGWFLMWFGWLSNVIFTNIVTATVKTDQWTSLPCGLFNWRLSHCQFLQHAPTHIPSPCFVIIFTFSKRFLFYSSNTRRTSAAMCIVR